MLVLLIIIEQSSTNKNMPSGKWLLIFGMRLKLFRQSYNILSEPIKSYNGFNRVKTFKLGFNLLTLLTLPPKAKRVLTRAKSKKGFNSGLFTASLPCSWFFLLNHLSTHITSKEKQRFHYLQKHHSCPRPELRNSSDPFWDGGKCRVCLSVMGERANVGQKSWLPYFR